MVVAVLVQDFTVPENDAADAAPEFHLRLLTPWMWRSLSCEPVPEPVQMKSFGNSRASTQDIPPAASDAVKPSALVLSPGVVADGFHSCTAAPPILSGQSLSLNGVS
jgi:hypothetical protein